MIKKFFLLLFFLFLPYLSRARFLYKKRRGLRNISIIRFIFDILSIPSKFLLTFYPLDLREVPKTTEKIVNFFNCYLKQALILKSCLNQSLLEIGSKAATCDSKPSFLDKILSIKSSLYIIKLVFGTSLKDNNKEMANRRGVL